MFSEQLKAVLKHGTMHEKMHTMDSSIDVTITENGLIGCVIAS